MSNQKRFALIGSSIGKVDQTDAPVDGDLLVFDGTDERWEYVNLSGLSGINADTLDSLDSTAFARLASTGTISAVWTFSTGPVLANDVAISWINTDDAAVELLNFTGGQAGDSNFASVQLLADWDGIDAATSFTEESGNTAVATFAGTAQLDTAQQKFGTASLLLDGNSDYVTFPDIAGYVLGSSDFTWEAWVRFNALPSASSENGAIIAAQWLSTGNQRSYVWGFDTSDEMKFQYSTDGSTSATLTSSDAPTLATGQWYHCAVVRDGATTRMFIDGVALTVSGNISGTIHNSTDTLRIGAINTSAGFRAYVDGWIDDLRLTAGVARYTAGFTPPIAAFTAGAQVDSYLELGNSAYDAYSASALYVRGGKALRIYDSGNTDYASFAHDSTDFNTTFANTGKWNITATEVELNLTTFDVNGIMTLDSSSGLTALSVGGGGVELTGALSSGTIGLFLNHSALPRLAFNEGDAAANNQLWYIDVNSAQLGFSCVNDARSALTDWLSVSRSANTATQITFAGTELQFDGTTLDINAASDFAGQAVFNAVSTGGSGSIKLAASSNPGIYWDDGAAAADTGNWLLYSSSGTMRWRIYNDAGSVNTEFLTVQRSTTTVSQITLAATELQFDGTTLDINAATYLPAGTTTVAPLNIPHGSAPSAPVNGDIWTTTAGLYVRINGSTVGPLS